MVLGPKNWDGLGSAGGGLPSTPPSLSAGTSAQVPVSGSAPTPRAPVQLPGQRAAPASCFLRVVHTKVQGQSPRRAKKARQACEPEEAWCHPAVIATGPAYHTLCVKTECRVKRANAEPDGGDACCHLLGNKSLVPRRRRDHFQGLRPSMVATIQGRMPGYRQENANQRHDVLTGAPFTETSSSKVKGRLPKHRSHPPALEIRAAATIDAH